MSDEFDLISEDWLRSVGFKWHQLERQPHQHVVGQPNERRVIVLDLVPLCWPAPSTYPPWKGLSDTEVFRPEARQATPKGGGLGLQTLPARGAYALNPPSRDFRPDICRRLVARAPEISLPQRLESVHLLDAIFHLDVSQLLI